MSPRTRQDLKQSIIHVALVVREYDDAICFYVDKLGFTLVGDSYRPVQDKRWVLVAPVGSTVWHCTVIAGSCSSEAVAAEPCPTASPAAASR